MNWSVFLRRIKLIESFSHEIDLPKSEFIQKMNEYVLPEPKNFFARVRKLLTPSSRPYLGKVDDSGFQIRRRIKYAEGFRYLIRVHGDFEEDNNRTRVRFTMNGVNKQVVGLIILKNLFYVFALIIALRGTAAIVGSQFGYVIGVLFLIMLVFLIPYLIMRFSMKKSKALFRREFDFIASGPH